MVLDLYILRFSGLGMCNAVMSYRYTRILDSEGFGKFVIELIMMMMVMMMKNDPR